ncbi:DUF7210 family protein [Clostridium novyi]|uniref:DUF7210 family protein n=1 Tax=Clostridium novyi TaxID=1542 RepID=UPI0004DA2084|nr:hypothetical protein [Clostridium novyi]KEH84592.1 hypothetical protein Z966_p0047 [Clostridium novyi A str. NCTC 538]KEH84743.1 hypothetical protein Z965_p0047 [Clostridium novyi A str. BKT29909]
MAKAKIIKVKALVNLKYDKKCVSIGDEFGVRAEDAKEMKAQGYVEILGELPEESEEEGTGEAPKEGE